MQNDKNKKEMVNRLYGSQLTSYGFTDPVYVDTDPVYVDTDSFKVIAATGQGSAFSLKKRLQELLTFQGYGKLRLRVNDISVLQIRFTDLNGVSVDMTHKDPEKITLYLDLSIRIWKKRVKLSSFTPEGIISDIETEQIIFLHEAQEHYTKQLRSGVCHNIIEKEIV